MNPGTLSSTPVEGAELIISIVSWNTKELLARCLDSLLANTQIDLTRIVVVDNASSDGTVRMLRENYPTVEVLESGGNLGFGRAHNLIRTIAQEPFVLFLNPDTEFSDPAHEKMLAVLKQHSGVGAVGCQLTDPDGTPNALTLQWKPTPFREFLRQLFISSTTLRLIKAFVPYQDPTSDGFVRLLSGGCMMVRRQVLEQVGWFDERFFMYSEDAELSVRIGNAHWRLFYLGTVSVVHVGGGASAKAPSQFSILMMCESISLFYEKYHGAAGRRIYTIAIFLRAFFRIFVLSFAGLVTSSSVAGARIELAKKKNLTMLRWSIGQQKAAVPK